MSDLVFLSPQALWALCALPIVALFPRRGGSSLVVALRILVFAALILGAARPALVGESGDAHHVVVVDLGALDAEGIQRTRDFAERLAGSASVTRVELAGADATSAVERTEDGARELPERLRSIRLRDSVSQPGAGLAEAALSIPRGAEGEVTLVSDGLATTRDWGRAVRDLVSRGTPIHVVEIPPVVDDVYPLSVEAVGSLRVGRGGRVAVEIHGRGRVDLDLLIDGARVGGVVGWELTGVTRQEFVFEPERAGFLRTEVRVRGVEGQNRDAANDVLATVLPVDDPVRALYLGERVTGGAARLGELIGRGIELRSLPPLTTEIPDLRAFDLVILDDRPADSLPDRFQEEIASAAVRDGVGLFVSGGSGSFGPGGYHQTPVGAILPVDLVQKEEKRDPSTTLVVIIDTSGSMSGERVQIAKEVARLAIRRLLPHDKVGIVEFYGTKQWAAPIQSAANAIDIQRAINRLDAGGGTVILPAIEEAFYAMQNVQTRYKHVLVLTDGGVESGDFESILRKMAGRGMNVSTVLVGGNTHSEFLVNLANWGKGHFYSASNRFQLPEVLLKQPSTSKIPAYRPGGFALSSHGGEGWWGDVDASSVPDVHGYVETRLRPGAQLLLETTQGRHPIATTWRYGLGRVTTLMTEPVGRGTEAWSDWSGYGPWLLRVLSRTARDRDGPFVWSTRREGRELIIEARRIDGSDLRPRVRLEVLHEEEGGIPESTIGSVKAGDAAADEDAAREREPTFERRAPELFAARTVVDPAARVACVGGVDGGGAETRFLSEPALVSAARIDPRGALDLAELASVSGGTSLELSELSRFEPETGGGRSLSLVRIWPILLSVALALYVLELVCRRSPWTAEENL